MKPNRLSCWGGHNKECYLTKRPLGEFICLFTIKIIKPGLLFCDNMINHFGDFLGTGYDRVDQKSLDHQILAFVQNRLSCQIMDSNLIGKQAQYTRRQI